MRLTIAVLLLLCKCLIFELVTSELSDTDQPTCPLKICTDVLKDLGASEARFKALEAQIEENKKESRELLKDLGASEARFKALEIRLADSEAQIEEIKKESRDKPKVAFSASLGSNGFIGPVNIDLALVYKDVFINVGEAYNSATGIFTAPVRGVYYFSFFYHCGTDHETVLILKRNGEHVALMKHNRQSPGTVENGGNGVTLLLEKGDTVYIVLQKNSWIWDSGSVTVFSGFLIDAM